MAAYLSSQHNREAGCVMGWPMLTEKCRTAPAESGFAREKTHGRNVRLVIMYLYLSNIGVMKSRKTI